MLAMSTLLSLPVIDLAPLLEEPLLEENKIRSITPAQRELAIQVRKGCMEHGFFYIKNHGIPSHLTKRMFESSRSLFKLPAQEKDALSSKKSDLFRGYISTSDGLHTCNSSMKDKMGLDQKESFTLGAENEFDGGESKSPMHGANQWPREELLPEFESTMKEYWDAQLKLCRIVARALALSLDLNLKFFDPYLTDPVAQMVLLKYAPRPKSMDESCTKRNLGCGEHTDCGFLTILAQDSVPGLEVLDASLGWKEVPAISDSFLVNLGDMTARWTNDRYKSTKHRVYNQTDYVRYSVPFFCNCDFDAPIKCIMDEETEEKLEAKYDDTTAGVYIMEKLGLMRKT